LGACLLAALLSAVLTVRMTTALFRKMEWQTAELGRVSWHLLEDQESAARRFSHELHDELGQSLTAVKANLAALSATSRDARLDDCGSLVDDAISNVRELSQLLHPPVLDDFGLDAALRWLAEGFTQRTGVGVAYESDFTGRLAEDIELHLFRITQEAFTNIARHAGASRVELALQQSASALVLRVADNGRGLVPASNASPKGLGMIGMRARARSAGGELNLQSAPGAGLEIKVRVPR
ncbi:MAG: sensor histidine kinase, partial [Acidobacteria bacterium]|nr:sensor histidine kinase [Acidobacteriota bacterium]